MGKTKKQVIGGLALAAAAIGAAGAFLKLRKKRGQSHRRTPANDVWARPGMQVTFRAELMPGRERGERTFLVKELLPSGRVSLQDASGEHASREFEPVS